MIIGTVANARDVVVPIGPVNKFYFPHSAAAPVSPAHINWVHTSTSVRRALRRTPGTSGGGISAVSQSEAVAGGTQLGLCGQFVSEPLQAQTIGGLSGNSGRSFRQVVLALQSAIGMNFRLRTQIRVVSNDGTVSRGVAHSAGSATSPGSDFPSGGTPQSRTVDWQSLNSTPVVAQANDRLVIELGWMTDNTTSTTRSGTLYFGDPDNASGGVDLTFNQTQGLAATTRPWLEFENPILFA